MQKVLPFKFPDNDNRYSKVDVTRLNDAEQQSLIFLAIEVLEMRHQPGVVLTSPKDTMDYLRLLLGERRNEVFGVLFLDNKHRVICNEELFSGTVNSSAVHPRVVAQQACDCNASAVICYHNHPAGDPEPSQSDIRITKRLNDTLELIDVRVLDHYVVGYSGAVSFAERGLL